MNLLEMIRVDTSKLVRAMPRIKGCINVTIVRKALQATGQGPQVLRGRIGQRPGEDDGEIVSRIVEVEKFLV
ncbi:hypothetical protein, partial [Klebsiella variicola]|uniref:hypothetical protein n=1 Tax=Klebsiella variicola TaxID=244366 RepID=UPI00272F07B0